MRGFEDGTFRPDDPVTRGQMAIMIANAFELATEADIHFTDVGPKSKAYESIRKIVAEGITEGYEDQSFQPDRTLIRSDFAAFMARAMNDEFKVK